MALSQVKHFHDSPADLDGLHQRITEEVNIPRQHRSLIKYALRKTMLKRTELNVQRMSMNIIKEIPNIQRVGGHVEGYRNINDC